MQLTFAGDPMPFEYPKNKKKEGLSMRAMLEVSTEYGYDIAIYEEDLEGITVGELWKLRISRPVLKRCFAEGLVLMQGKTENDRVRPCAYLILGGKQWVVHLVQYPGRSDPLTEGREASTALP
jgi:hypothetical protein